MYAVFEDGSRQYRVSEGEMVRVDYRELEPGARVQFEHVLVLQSNEGTQIGRPYVGGAKVVAEVVEHPSIKLYIQHFRRRKNYRRRTGHRQHYTTVKINHILMPGQELPPETPAAPPPAETPAAAPAAT
jgi:large subunit ribosomal protein L21